MTQIHLSPSISINLESLIKTRVLISANSGSGKSYCIRKFLEEAFGKVQLIVLDIEGEFKSLREKHDFILVGKDGDIPASIKTADLLARKLLETRASAIIDLYELKHQERMLFVKRFAEAMVDSPKDLWHPCIIVIDEGHLFCSEKQKEESKSAIIDLATRGRKREFALVLATQRLSKLNKDAAAELLNKLVGRTSLDIDRNRASEELGFTSKEQNLSLRNLEPGSFYNFGPSISNEVKLGRVGLVKTTHEAGSGKNFVFSPPSTEVRNQLAKLSDLAKLSEVELKTIADFKSEVQRLKMELRKHSSSIPDSQTLEKEVEKRVSLATSRLQKQMEFEFNKSQLTSFKEWENKLILSNTRAKNAEKVLSNATTHLSKVVEELKTIDLFKEIIPLPTAPIFTFKTSYGSVSFASRTPTKINQNVFSPTESAKKGGLEAQGRDVSFGHSSGQARILKAAAMFYPNSVSKNRIATLAKLSPKSGTFGTYLGQLKAAGYLEEKDGGLTATDSALGIAGDVPELPTDSEALIEMWATKLGGGMARMLKEIAAVYPEFMSKEELGDKIGMTYTSGTFGTYLGKLKSNGLIEVKGQQIAASKELFG